MKNRRRGKRVQKAIAEKVNGLNIGILGGEDVITDKWSIEVKSRVKFAGEKFLIQAEKNCSKGRIPIAIVHIHGKRHENDIVLIRLKDFEQYLKQKED